MAEETTSVQNQQVDLEKIIRGSKSRFLRNVPGFVIRWMKRLLHEDDINDVLSRFGHLEGVAFIEATVEYFNIRLHHAGTENLPREGKFVFASNHPLGGFDGLLLIMLISKYFGHTKAVVNNLLMNLNSLRPVFADVNVLGANTKDTIRRLDEVFQSDNQVMFFPAGLVSRRHKGQIRDLEWKKSFVSKAIQHQRNVIPVHVSGNLTRRFYRVAALRKFLGIKVNLEMFLLPGETFGHRNHEFTITFGRPIPWAELKTNGSAQEWAEKIRQIVYTLPSASA